MLTVLVAVLLFGFATILFHWLFQNNRVYKHFDSVIQTYENVSEEGEPMNVINVKKPFISVHNGNMLSWDAQPYNILREHLYDPDYTWKGYFAFFPLFPLLWRFLNLSPIGISIFNWFLYAIGLSLVALLFGNSLPRWHFGLLLCLPFAVIFMIPYSEALFFICIALGMLGIMKNRYWLYFVGFFFAVATRSAGNILIVAWIIVDVLSAFSAKSSVKTTLLDILRHIAPVVLGILAVMIFQHLRGAEHWFEYVLAQKEWGKYLSLPTLPFTDWSKEGSSVTRPLVYMLFIPAMVWLAIQAWHMVVGKTKRTIGSREKLRMLSVLFFVGNVLIALLTQHGCLNSLARYLTCTPFFAFLVIDYSIAIKDKPWRWGMLIAILATLILCFSMFFKSFTLGSWIVLLLAILVFYGANIKGCVRYTLLTITILLNIFWTAYLFNCFLNDGWIFT